MFRVYFQIPTIDSGRKLCQSGARKVFKWCKLIFRRGLCDSDPDLTNVVSSGDAKSNKNMHIHFVKVLVKFHSKDSVQRLKLPPYSGSTMS